jgi:ATP-dependent RNA helicase DeaD
VEAREAGVTRGQNAVYVMPHDWASIAQFLAPLLERVEDGRELQLLIITPDADVAAAVTAAAVKLTGGRDIGIVAATSAKRAARLIKLKPAQVVAGAPDTLVELLKTAAIKLAGVRSVCIAWADELLAQGATPALETVMTEAPKDAGRTIVTAEVTPAIEELLERYARRARRVAAPIAESDQPMPVEYVTVSTHSRLASLRRLLDETDPASALVFVRDGSSRVEVTDLLAALGYSGDASPIRVGLTAAPGTDTVILFDLPASREELREAAGSSRRTIALIQPRQLGSLRALTAGGALKPITLAESGAHARTRDALIRAELRSALSAGQFGRELLSLEPLLDDFDGIEIAAAALQLLEKERADRAATPAATATPSRQREPQSMVGLFVNVGSRDGARPADIVGAIASHPGVTSGDIGRVDVRESHTTVEVAAGVADLVIEKLTGSSIRGRRAVARRDVGSGKRDAGSRKREAVGGKRDAGRGAREADTRGKAGEVTKSASRFPLPASRERPASRPAPSRREESR